MLKESRLHDLDPQIEILRHAYPSLLKSDSLKYVGASPLRNQFHLGIIGTRRPTRAALPFVRELMAQLRQWPMRVISGGALGVDAIAHAEALRAGLPTYAWIVGDPCRPPPLSNRDLFLSISRTANSAVISPSEFYRHQNQGLEPHFWIKRNYWIAANIDVLLVVEAQAKSGTWWTVKACQDFGIPVYALPGCNSAANFAGTNSMISKSYAHPVLEFDELTNNLRSIAAERAKIELKETLRLAEKNLEGNFSEDR